MPQNLMNDFSLQSAVSSMKLAVAEMSSGSPSALGITDAAWRLFTGDELWQVKDKAEMRRVFDSVCFYTLDLQGIPHHTVAAEYIAAVIALFVGGPNARVACSWVAENTPSAAALGSGEQPTYADTTPEQLFALVIQLHDNPARADCAAQFHKKTKLAVARALARGGQ